MLLTAGTTHNVVEDLTSRRNALAGIELFDADDGRNGNTVRNNTLNDNELGDHARSAAPRTASSSDNTIQRQPRRGDLSSSSPAAT